MDPLTLLTLPTDVLFLLFHHLSVVDILTARQTCRVLYDLSHARSVWHDALHTHILAAGLPVPGLHQRSLSALSADELERLTLRALALRLNWTSPSPRTTRCVDLVPPDLPSDARARNLAVHYLPGREGRYLLTVTFYDEPAAPRKYIIDCWDIGKDTSQPRPVATLRCMNFTGATVNTDPKHPGILAVTRRGPSDIVTTCIFSIDFHARDASAAFIPLQEFPSFRFPLALEGSVFAASGPDNVVRVLDIEAGCVRAVLCVPREHDDPTLRNEEQRCMSVVLFRRHALTFCKQWIHLYGLPASMPTALVDPPPPEECDPIASHKWQWRIDSLVVTPRLLLPASAAAHACTTSCADHDAARCSAEAGFPPIDVLIRFDTWFPWPVNILHHYVLAPNPACTGTPYLHVGGAPAMAHSIPSPIRLFTPSDMVLGRRGTALWLDAQAYEGGPAQAGDHGQRIAGRMLAAPSSSFSSAGGPGGSGGGDAAEGGGEGGDRVSPGWFGEERAGGGAMVFHMQKEDDGWNRLALDEEEGRIAVGTVYGRVHLFEYAPQGELAL